LFSSAVRSRDPDRCATSGHESLNPWRCALAYVGSYVYGVYVYVFPLLLSCSRQN